jgi:hypothetical protein
MDPATTGKRGLPNVSADFLSIKADQNGSFPLVVWHTYQHKNELFPANGQTASNFDSNMPTYNYISPPTAGLGSPSFNLFNNLDETSEIGLCNMFAQYSTPPAPLRVAYEAKVNRAVFNYANTHNLTKCDASGNCPTLNTVISTTKGNLVQYGGICSTNTSIVSLPCGGAVGDPADPTGEGAIEIKAAWRQLTDKEAASGRFFTQNVIFYKGDQYVNQTYNNAVYGLIALHIIHKTQSFPTFVFATWEQVDNYDDATNQNTEDLVFHNTLPPPPQLPNIPVTRNHPIHSQIVPVNSAVRTAFTSKDPTTIWQYYRLIGVQATPVNGPPAASAPTDELSYYYLANIVVETNQTLQNFFGQAPEGLVQPFKNVYLNGAPGSPFQMGGCQGCHGTQGQSVGGDMSRLIGAAPSNSAGPPESIDAGETASAKSYSQRSKAANRR